MQFLFNVLQVGIHMAFSCKLSIPDETNFAILLL